MNETINGLHSCKPGNDPVVGQVKLFVIEHRTGKNNKPYIKIRSANADNGGTPHRILGAEKTDFVDKYGNHSYNLEVEASSSPPTAFSQARATMQQGEPTSCVAVDEHGIEQESSVRVPNGEDGVTEARKHLMKAVNLYGLCIAAVDKGLAGKLPEVAHTSEQFQSTLASIWIEASGRRSTNGVDWWSYIDLMPDKPLPVNGGKHAAIVKPIPKGVCLCENTDGDNPLCPIHST